MSEQNPLEAPSKNPLVNLWLIVKQILFKKGDADSNSDPGPQK